VLIFNVGILPSDSARLSNIRPDLAAQQGMSAAIHVDLHMVKAAAPQGDMLVTAPMYRRFLALIIDIIIGKAINAFFTVALKLASIRLGNAVSDDQAKIFGNMIQVCERILVRVCGRVCPIRDC